jgi:hypothetical protein
VYKLTLDIPTDIRKIGLAANIRLIENIEKNDLDWRSLNERRKALMALIYQQHFFEDVFQDQ